WRGIAVTVGINWLVQPVSMALLGWLFIGWLFRPWLPSGQIDSYIPGVILLLLGLSSITVPWETLFLSVVLYIVVPVIASQVWRRSLLAAGGEAALAATLRRLQPISLL